MHNNDPRVVANTQPVRYLHFEEAAELAYFGAKILHPTCIQPAKVNNIPVRLLNTMQPEAPGTIISNELEKGKIKAVAAKDNITAIKIKSGRMLLATGFLRKVFEIFEEYQTPIDMKGLKFRSGLSIDNQNSKENYYGSAIHGYYESGDDGWGSTVIEGGGSASRTGTRQTSTTWNNILTYDNTFGKHHINLMGGQEFYNFQYEYMYGYGAGISMPT